MRALILVLLASTVVCSMPLLPAHDAALAQSDEGEAEDPAEERAAQFVGVRGPDAERVPGGTLLLAAYAVVWLLLFLYLLRMRSLQRQTAAELERLSSEVRASGSL